MNTSQEKLTLLQLELLKSFRYVKDENQIKEVKSLLNFYFRQKLDDAIDNEERKKDFSAALYKQWLNGEKK